MTPSNETDFDASVDLLTVDEIAAKLRVPASWVYSHADDLGVLRVGKYLRFDWETARQRLIAQRAGNLQTNDLR